MSVGAFWESETALYFAQYSDINLKLIVWNFDLKHTGYVSLFMCEKKNKTHCRGQKSACVLKECFENRIHKTSKSLAKKNKFFLQNEIVS